MTKLKVDTFEDGFEAAKTITGRLLDEIGEDKFLQVLTMVYAIGHRMCHYTDKTHAQSLHENIEALQRLFNDGIAEREQARIH